MTGLLVGIDVGSQSAKVVVHDATGAVQAVGTHRLRPWHTPRSGVVEHPDDDLWEALTAACRAATDALGDARDSIVGVGLCGVRSCRVLMRPDGTLAAPVISWMDQRLSRPYDGSGADVGWVSASSGYLTHRLTGRFRDSAASYEGHWPIDTDSWQWLADDGDLARFGVPRQQLLELVRPGDVLGGLTGAAAAATGLPTGVPVVATANDKAVEALGSGLRSGSDLLVSLGTYITAMTLGDRNRGQQAAFWTNLAALPGRYLYESTGIRRGMWTVSWLRDLLGEELLTRARAAGTGVEQLLNDGAEKVPPGSEGLLTVLDWLAPVDAPWRRGAVLGLDARHGPFHLYRSLLEAIALTMRAHATRMTRELGTEPTHLVLSGGGSQSEVMMQVMADVFELPVLRGAAPSAAALGAAISAAVAVGQHPSHDAAMSAMVHPDLVVEPDPGTRATYRALADVHGSLAATLEDVFRRTHALFG